MHTGNKSGLLGDKGPFCKCMDCARQRDERIKLEYGKVRDRLCADLPSDKLSPTIIQDANAQKVVRQITEEIVTLLDEYGESETLIGEKITNLLRDYYRAY